MKNSTLFLLSAGLCLFTSFTTAQPRPTIRAGFNYGGFSGYDGGKKTGIHAGISMQWTINRKWKVQPELLYSGTRQQYSAEESEAPVVKTLFVSYAALPVMVQYHPGSNFYLETGPQLSFLITAKDKSSTVGKTDVRRNLTNTQIGMNFGAGLQINLRNGFYVRYSLGLSHVTIYNANADYSRIVQGGFFFRLK
jgi:hypothetical protein